MPNLEVADSALTADRRKRAAALKGGGLKARRSKIANGRTLLPTADGHSLWARLVRDTMGSLIAHCGGASVISETQKLAVRRVSVLESELIHLEDRIALARQHGDEPDQNTIELYGRLADRQRRLSDPLGWHRAQREVSWRDRWMAETQADGSGTVEVETPTTDDATVVVVPPIESDSQ